jgi:signal peptidase I
VAGPDLGSSVDPAFPVEPVVGEDRVTAAASTRTRRGLHPVVELVLILVAAFGLAYVVQGWVVKPYRIPTISMVPTLKVGDMVLANRFVYHLHPPHRGDVIVFHPPGHGDVPARGATTEASVTFIKRVIGLPGETVKINRGTVVICSAPGQGCHALTEPYVNSHPRDTTSYGPVTVPKGEYFVMGDNRGDSEDSRVWGMLPAKNIIGEAFMVYWPLNRIGTL